MMQIVGPIPKEFRISRNIGHPTLGSGGKKTFKRYPKNSESLEILDIRRWEVGAKRRLNGTSKVNRRTDRQTDEQTDGHFDL